MTESSFFCAIRTQLGDSSLDDASRKLSYLRAGSITHGSELSFMEFLDVFKSFR